MSATTDKRAARPPLESVREAPFALRSDDDDDGEGDGLTLDGYGAVFNRHTIIDSWEGKFRESIAPGSMRKSFRENPPIVQFDHGRHVQIGSIPIAAIRSISEDVDPDLAPEGGAHVVARMFEDPLFGALREALAAKAIKGMSFRFSVVREQWEMPDGKVIRDEQVLMDELRRTWYEDVPDDELLLRTLKELRVPEIGPVVWPAYVETSVSVRSKTIDLGLLADGDPEQLDLLGRAIYLAPSDAPRPTGESTPAGEHPSTTKDAPRSTDSSSSAGEHPSKTTPRGRRAIDVTLRSIRDMQRDIDIRKECSE